MFFKRKIKIESKFKKGEFVSFHSKNGLIYGVIKNIKKINENILYDIMIGGEATWLAKDIEETRILKVKKAGEA